MLRDRKQNTRDKKKYILIVCEGEKTEPNYFRSFPIPSKQVELFIEGIGMNPSKIVQYALALKKEKENDMGFEIDSVWCVFDKDSFEKDDFTNAINRARAKGLKVAYSNESFELWYVLHFQYLSSQKSRNDLVRMLNSKLDGKYRKNDCSMYKKLQDKQGVAISNAQKLLKYHESISGIVPQNNNPSTTVHELVMFLNNEIKK